MPLYSFTFVYPYTIDADDRTDVVARFGRKLGKRLHTRWPGRAGSPRRGRENRFRCVRVILSGPFRRCRPRPPFHAACSPAATAGVKWSVIGQFENVARKGDGGPVQSRQAAKKTVNQRDIEEDASRSPALPLRPFSCTFGTALTPAGVASTGSRFGHGPANRRRPWPERLDEGSCAIDRNRIPSAQEPRARTRAGTVCAPSPRASRPRTGRRSGTGTPLVNVVNAAS